MKTGKARSKIVSVLILLGIFSLVMTGCTSGDKEQPAGEHPAGEHPTGDHPRGEHPAGEHPEGKDKKTKQMPGSIIKSDRKKLVIACGTNFLELIKLTPEGKKEMTGAEFLMGYGDRIAKE